MNEFEDFELFRKDDLTCPHCLYVYGDSWEYIDSGIEVTKCIKCDKSFRLEIHIEATYSTSKDISG